MDIKGLRSLNLVGTILFCIIGIALISAQYYQLNQRMEVRDKIEDLISPTSNIDETRDSEYTLCTSLLLLWLIIILTFTLLLYNFTVRGLDRKNYKTVKNWTFIGIIVGFAGGIIPLIIFIISYVSFDDAIRTQQYGQMQYGYPSNPIPIKNCIKCKRQIPPDSRLCPYCGESQSSIGLPTKNVPSPRLKKSTFNENQNREPLPPPLKSNNKE